jgi:hypothetical protein
MIEKAGEKVAYVVATKRLTNGSIGSAARNIGR